jgi:uncharacterized membrane protein required for colicin V production
MTNYIADIVVLLLIGGLAIFGFYKGFVKSIVSLASFLVSTIIAFALAKTVANALLSVDTIGNWVAGKEGSLYSLAYKIMDGLENITTSQLSLVASDSDALKALFNEQAPWFMKLLYPVLSSALTNTVYLASLSNAREILSLELAYGMFTLLVGIAIFIAIRIIAAVISIFFKSFSDGKKSFIGRLLGAVIGGAKGLLYTLVILCVLSLLSNVSFIQPISGYIENSKIASGLSSLSVKINTMIIENKEDAPRYERMVELFGASESNGGETGGGETGEGESESSSQTE